MRGMVTELEDGKDYFHGSLRQLHATIHSLNPEIEDWVIMPKEDFDTLQSENVALMEECCRLEDCLTKLRGRRNGTKRK